MADGYDCPVVMMSAHGTVETAVEATRLGAYDFVEKPLSLTKLLRTVERALDAGRRKRLAGARARVGARRAHRQEQGYPGPAGTGAARRVQLIAGAAARRIGIRTGSLRPLPALAERTSLEALFHGGRRELRRRSGRRAVRQRTGRACRTGR